MTGNFWKNLILIGWWVVVVGCFLAVVLLPQVAH